MKIAKIFCKKCSKLFDYKDYIAAYTADDKNKELCIDCQLEVIRKNNEPM